MSEMYDLLGNVQLGHVLISLVCIISTNPLAFQSFTRSCVRPVGESRSQVFATSVNIAITTTFVRTASGGGARLVTIATTTR